MVSRLMNNSFLRILSVFGFSLLLACGGGGGGTSAPPQPDLRTTWGAAVQIGYASNSGAFRFRFANPETLNPTLTWNQGGYSGYPGFSEYINGVWTKPSFPFSGTSFSNLQAIGDVQGNLTLIGLSASDIKSATRKGGVWGPVTTIGSTTITALDWMEAYPKAVLVGGSEVFVIWRKPQSDNVYKYDIFVSRLVSDQWVTDVIDTGTDGFFRLSGNPDGTAFATWYKGDKIFISRFSSGAWEASKALNVVADAFNSMSAYRYYLLSADGTKAILVTSTQLDGGLHISSYDGSQIQETVFSQNATADLFFSADIASDGAFVVAWTNPLNKATYARVFDGSQWGTLFQSSGYQVGAQIMDKNTAIIEMQSGDSLVVSVDWAAGSWMTPKALITSSSVSNAALGRTKQRQWLASWSLSSTSSSDPLFVIDGNPGR